MNDLWGQLPTDKEKDLDYASLSQSIPEPPKVDMLKTELIDLAGEAEAPKTYVDQVGKKKFEQRREEGIDPAPPVNIYEPGFRSDMYEAITNYFKKQKAVRDRNQALRERMGMRS